MCAGPVPANFNTEAYPHIKPGVRIKKRTDAHSYSDTLVGILISFSHDSQHAGGWGVIRRSLASFVSCHSQVTCR